MDEKMLIEKMVNSVEDVPPRAEVLAVRQHSLDEIEQRVTRFLNVVGETSGLPLGRRDWAVRPDHSLIRMPLGARAVAYHASGAMKLDTGLNPMESHFKKVEDREMLVKMIKEKASQLNIREWVGENESLSFERLWQIKAAAVSREGQAVEPILCRAVGAYRHFAGELPVWGAASVAIKQANEGKLDSLTVQVRETHGKVIERVEIIRPDQAAHGIFLQLSSLMGKSKIPVSEVAKPRWMRFGYLSLSRRKAQHLLEPVYVAAIEIEGPDEAQAYLFAISATEKRRGPPFPLGKEAPPVARRRAG